MQFIHQFAFLSTQDNAGELVTKLESDYQNEAIYNDLRCDANKIAKQ